MPTLGILTRRTADGEARYLVRYRLGGRGWPMRYAGTFQTLREAKARRDYIGGLIATGRNPADVLAQLADATPLRVTFAAAAERYAASRVDVAENTRQSIRNMLAHCSRTFGETPVDEITPSMIQEWIAASTAKPSSLRLYYGTLRSVLDHAGADPNPARDPNLRLPRREHEEINPPSRRECQLIAEHIAPRSRLAVLLLEATGMRVHELVDLTYGDLDAAGERFRIAKGKTKAARRWVAIPTELLDLILDSVPPDDQAPDRRVFQGINEDAIRNAMRRACQRAGIAHYTPHDYRHRWISLHLKHGVPIAEVCEAAGQSDRSVTLNTYAHVLVDD